MSNSCNPRKYHGAFDGLGVRLMLASCNSGAFTTAEKTSRNAVHDERSNELGDEQVRPHVHLVDGRGLDVLDRAGLDDREQPLGVTSGSRTDRHAPSSGRDGGGDASALGGGGHRRTRTRGRAGGLASGTRLHGTRPLEQMRGDARLGP